MILLGQVCGKQIIFVFFIENVFISSSFLKDAFAGCRILGCQFFSFNPLKIPFHFLLAFMFSDTRCAVLKLFFHYNNVKFFFGFIQDICLSLVFTMLIAIDVGMNFFEFILFEFC